MKLSLFLSCHVYLDIEKPQLLTDNSWLRFVTKLAEYSDNLEINSPTLLSNEKIIPIPLKTNITHKTFVQHDSFISFYLALFRNPCRSILRLINTINKSDIVLYRIPTPGFSLVALSCLLLHKPFCVFISGDIVSQADATRSPSFLLRYIAHITAFLRLSMHKLLCSYASYSYVVSSALVRKYSLKSNYRLFLTPIASSSQFHKHTPKASSLYPIKQLRLLRSCWIQPSKDLHTLLHACSTLVGLFDFKLSIAGGIKDYAYYNSITDLVSKLSLNQHVEFLGHIPNDHLTNLMSSYHLHLVTSSSEGMPRVCLEAAINHLPQILTNVGGVSDFYTNMVDCLIIEPLSANDLSSAITWAYRNYPNMAKYAEVAFSRM